jgi:hypothetical protein
MNGVNELKKGKKVNDELYVLIERDPGLSKYELSKKIGWSMGKTDGAINRLLAEGRVFIKEIEMEGRQVKLVYPSHLRPSNMITVPETELRRGNPTWLSTAYFYALDSETMGITGGEFEAWDRIACFKNVGPIEYREGQAVIELPDDFKDFYNLERKHFSVSLNANNILVTVTGRIVASK